MEYYEMELLCQVLKCVGSKFDSKFYRPLSNLSEVSKLVEMTIHDQVYEYLVNEELLHPYHHGFLKHHSTATALQQLVDLWMRAADQGKLSASLLLDLSAGFDVVNHKLLLLKLSEYGFDEVSLNWFHSYLTGRSQCVQVESSFSPLLEVPWGVPQGSILGPLLFTIFINELPEVVTPTVESEENSDDDDDEDKDIDEGTVVVYADDNTPTVADADPNRLFIKTQTIANNITEWFHKNDMVVSGEKTKLMLIGTQINRKLKVEDRGDLDTSVIIEGETVEPTRSEKLLGILVNNSLTWKNHLYGDDEHPGLLKDLSKRAGVLKVLRKYLPDAKFRQAVAAIFTSKLIYCISVWTGIWDIPGQVSDGYKVSIGKQDMRRLQVLQNKTLRLLTRADQSTPTSTLTNLARCLSVHQLGAYHTANQVFQVHQSGMPVYHQSRLFQNNHSLENQVTVRSQNNLQSRVNFKLSTCRSSFFYQGAQLWSALPMDIKISRNSEQFKSRCKKWIGRNIKVKP